MAEKKKYDSTVARIAGNLLSGCHPEQMDANKMIEAAQEAVMLARAIVAEVQRTEPEGQG